MPGSTRKSAATHGSRSAGVPHVKPEELRQYAINIREGIATCEYNVQELNWQWCNVTLQFEGNRKIPYTDAPVYATTLYEAAWKTAVIDAVREEHFGPMNPLCNLFVLSVARRLGLEYSGLEQEALANDIYDYLANVVQSETSGWQRLDEGEVLASQEGDGRFSGQFVVGAAHSVAGSGEVHGHVVLATPNGYPPKHMDGNGPWSIDAKRADQLRCFHASQLFHTDTAGQLTAPIWAVYRP